MLSTPDDTSSDELPKEFLAIEEWAEQELLAHEKSALGFYIGHPLDRFAHLISKYTTATVDALPKADNYSVVTLAGVQNAIRVVPFKNGKAAWLSSNLKTYREHRSHRDGDDFDRYEELLTSDEPLLLRGRLSYDRDEDHEDLHPVVLGAIVRKHPSRMMAQMYCSSRTSAHNGRKYDFYQEPATQRPGLPISARRSQTPDHQGQCALSLCVRTDESGGDAVVTLVPITKWPQRTKSPTRSGGFSCGCGLRIQ